VVRIGIEGGFAAGAHYTVSFRGGKAHSVRHDSFSFDIDPARSTSCAPYGMLREAIERGDAGETATLACAVPGWGAYRPGALDLDKDPVPTPARWRTLVGMTDGGTAACGMAAMGNMLMLSRPGASAWLTSKHTPQTSYRCSST